MKHFSLAIFAVVTLVSVSAHAEYVCSATYYPPGLGTGYGYGSYGHIKLSLTSAPGCTGTDSGNKYLCSAGHGQAVCAKNAAYTDAGMVQLFGTVVRALETGRRVTSVLSACDGSNVLNCWAALSIHAM